MENINDIDSRISFRRGSINSSTKSVTFTRNIFNILSAQLFFILVFMILVGKSSSLKKFLLRQAFLCVLMLLVCVFSAIALRRGIYSKQFPVNYALLASFTISLGYVLCRFSYQFASQSLVTSFLLHVSSVTGLGLYLCTADKQINFRSAAATCFFSMAFGGLIALVFYNVELSQLLLCSIGGTIISWYLTYVAHLIYQQRRDLCIQDQIVGVISLYTDVFKIAKQLIPLRKPKEVKQQ